MGIYTNNTNVFNEAYDYASEIPANEAYGAAFGCAHILADCQANDMALFESAIYSDFAEVKALQEGVGYVNENAFTDVIKKIVEMFKKLLAKIKGIFAAFIAKLTGAFRDGKTLVKKYEKQIIKYGNWKDFKCKCRQPENDNVINAINAMFKYDKDTTGMQNAGVYKLVFSTTNTVLSNDVQTLLGTKDAERISEMDNSDIKDKLVKKYIDGVTEYEDVAKQIEEKIWKDEKEIDGDDNKIDGSFFSKNWIKGVLNEDKWEKNVKKFNEKLEKNINVIIDNLSKTDDGLATWMSKNDGKKLNTIGTVNNKNLANANDKKIEKVSGEKDWAEGTGGAIDPQLVQKGIRALQKIAGQEQEVITKVTSEYMSQVKFAMANARKVWTAAAAWSSGVHKESVEYAEAVGECAAEQFYVNMEAL